MDDHQAQIELIVLLLARLARISADSPWAYKASGLRGSLLRCLAQLEAEEPPTPGENVLGQLDWLVGYGFELLEKAARNGKWEMKNVK